MIKEATQAEPLEVWIDKVAVETGNTRYAMPKTEKRGLYFRWLYGLSGR